MTHTDAFGVTFRPAGVDDEAVLSALAARLGAIPLPPWRTGPEIAEADCNAMMSAVRRGDRDDGVFVAERGGAVVGCLHILIDVDFFGRRHAHLSVVAVAPDAEGSGVGRAIMNHAERWARERTLALLTLNVFAGNARARALYERHGYEPEIVKYAKPLE